MGSVLWPCPQPIIFLYYYYLYTKVKTRKIPYILIYPILHIHEAIDLHNSLVNYRKLMTRVCQALIISLR